MSPVLNVWVVTAEVWHSCERKILGVYATKEAAEAAWPKPPKWFDEVTVESYEVIQ